MRTAAHTLAGPSRSAARTLHTTAPTLVKRPQRPFQAFIPPDPTRHSGTPLQGKRELAHLQHLQDVEDGHRVTKVEQYGSDNGFGLRSGDFQRHKYTGSGWKRAVDAFRQGKDIAPGRSWGGARTREREDSQRRTGGGFEPRRTHTPRQDYEQRDRPRRRSTFGLRSNADSESPSHSKEPEPRELFGAVREESSHERHQRRSGSGFGLRSKHSESLAHVKQDRAPRESHDRPPRDDREYQSRPREDRLDRASRTSRIDDDAAAPTEASAPLAAPAKRRWQPTKKLTFAAMAGLRELHIQDPTRFTRSVLSEQFGISEEAVKRILRSKFRSQGGDEVAMGMTPGVDGPLGPLESGMGKWDRSPESGEDVSPVPTIRRAFAMKRALEAQAAEAGEARE